MTTDAKIDSIYDLVDDMMHRGDWLALDEQLETLARVAMLPDDEMLAWLTMTLPAKSRLPSRAKLMAKARLQFAASTLVGLE